MASVAKIAAAGASRCAARASQKKSEEAPAWQRIETLFRRHGQPLPPTRLRDELVMHLLASDREECAARAELKAQSTASDALTPNYPTPSTSARSSDGDWRGFRWTGRPDRWRKRWAVLPVFVGEDRLWWGWYWTQPAPEGGTYVSFDEPAAARER